MSNHQTKQGSDAVSGNPMHSVALTDSAGNAAESDAGINENDLQKLLPEELCKKASSASSKRGIPTAQLAREAVGYTTSGLLWRFCYACVLLIGLLNGLSAPPSGAMMMIAPDGSLLHMESFIPLFQALPLADIFFKDLFWPGIALILVNGIPNLIACTLILRRNRFGFAGALVCGLLLIAWALTEIFWIKIPPAGSIVYLIMGVFQTLSAAYLVYAQSHAKEPSQEQLRDRKLLVKSVGVYCASLPNRFMRSYIVLVCVGNAVSAIPSAVRLAGDYQFSNVGIAMAVALVVIAGVLSCVALPYLLRRDPKGYVVAIVCGIAFCAWTLFETSVMGAYPTGWLEYLAQGSGSLNLVMGLLMTLFAVVLHYKSGKQPAWPVA